MSLTIFSQVIAGFEVYIRTVNKNITRYSQDTGEPYVASVFSHREIVMSSVGSLVEAGEYFHEDEKLGCGLEIFCVDDEPVLGLKVAEVRWKPGRVGFNTEMPAAVREFGVSHGVEPKMFLRLDIS